jgi:hypothetical protein
MFYSGANAQAQGNIDQDFANRATNLDTARYNDIASQRQAMVGFQGQTAADKQAALTDAMSRISSKYNIGMSQVPQGKTTTIRQQVV